MTLSRQLRAAAAQLDAMLAADLPLEATDVAQLRDFLRACRTEAVDLEAAAPRPLILSLPTHRSS